MYSRSFERAMVVLRTNKASLMTILEVLMYDPLYNWSMTPEKARRIQRRRRSNDAGDEEGPGDLRAAQKGGEAGHQEQQQQDLNKMAVRVLRRVAQKLDGQEEGHIMSVEGQVNALIQQVTFI